jgi:hypothetical protein
MAVRRLAETLAAGVVCTCWAADASGRWVQPANSSSPAVRDQCDAKILMR